MRINIVNLDKDNWILTKFARKLHYNLKRSGHVVFSSKKAKKDVDVNHYIIFLFQKENKESYFLNTINTTMLTHVNDNFRYDKIRKISNFMNAGIAMSRDHAHFIKSKALGLKKIFYVLPPNDNDLKLKKINLGFFTNLYSDGRKNQKFFIESVKKISPELIKLSIIGKGWKELVGELKAAGYEISYQRFFFRSRYISTLKDIDYLIYLGNDEGSMSFLDALQLGIKTIMIPQGFQKDLEKFITFKIDKNLKNFPSILKKITDEKNKFLEIREKLTWENYTQEHVKIWESLK
mgnify:FL=1